MLFSPLPKRTNIGHLDMVKTIIQANRFGVIQIPKLSFISSLFYLLFTGVPKMIHFNIIISFMESSRNRKFRINFCSPLLA